MQTAPFYRRMFVRAFMATCLGSITLPVAASPSGPNADVVSRTVSTAGLDLRTAAAQATLRHRIAVAAYKVCGQVMQDGPGTNVALPECVQRATADARGQLDTQIVAARSRALVASVAGH